MKKKILLIITITLLSLFLTACNPAANMLYGDYFLEVENFGPSDEASKYYVYYTEDSQKDINIYTVFLFDTASSKEMKIMEFGSIRNNGIGWHIEDDEVLITMRHYASNIYKDAKDNIIDTSNIAFEKDEISKLITFHYNFNTEELFHTEYVSIKEENDYLPDDYTGTYILDTCIPAKINERYIFISKRFGNDKLYYSEDYHEAESYEGKIIAQLLAERSGVYSTNAYYDEEDGLLYFSVTELKGFLTGPNTYKTPDDERLSRIDDDILFEFNPDTKECKAVMRLYDGYSRIIGYYDRNVYIWHFNRIYKQNLDTKEKTTLSKLSIPPSIFKEKKISFYWTNDKLVIIDKTNNKILDVVNK